VAVRFRRRGPGRGEEWWRRPLPGALVGEHVWNFADFATGPGIFRVDGNRKGVFTRDRRPKAAAYALRRRWRDRYQTSGTP
jgi:beta-galactosidase/beta-glucuronidase